MPSRQSRSRSYERSKSPERGAELPSGVSPISESQYFQKSDEFRLWLKEEKGKVKNNSFPLQSKNSLDVNEHSTLTLFPVIGHGGGISPFILFFPLSRAKKKSRKTVIFANS